MFFPRYLILISLLSNIFISLSEKPDSGPVMIVMEDLLSNSSWVKYFAASVSNIYLSSHNSICLIALSRLI